MTEDEIKVEEQTGIIFDNWMENYTAISKLLDDSYLKLYKPWLESTGELFEKAIDTANSNSPDRYREFYDVWTSSSNGKIYRFEQIPTAEIKKWISEMLLASAEKSNDIYSSLIYELEENSRKTKEILKGDADPAKYKEIYDLWIKSHSRIFDELLTLPFRDNIKESLEKYTGISDIYSDTFVKISKLWNDSYTKLYGTWADATLQLSKKSEEIYKGKVNPEAYKEFYDLWTNVHEKTYGKLFSIQSVQKLIEDKEDLKSPKDKLNTVFELFVKSTQVYTKLYKSWITILEKLSQKSKELAKQYSRRDVYKETFNLWIKLYQKAFDSFFDNTPTF